MSITIRTPDSIHRAHGAIQNGTFNGRWHFSFGDYHDPHHMRFGTLRVFNDDTLSPGAVWPLHPHRDNEVVTYCAEGEFRHADEHGLGGVLEKGWVQHTTVGRGMWHSEINNLKDRPMRFIQMWFLPSVLGLEPSVEQKRVTKPDQTDKFLPLVSNVHPNALPIASDARVFSSFLNGGRTARHRLENGRGAYLYVVEGGPVGVNGNYMDAFGAAEIRDEAEMLVEAAGDAEMLLIDVPI